MKFFLEHFKKLIWLIRENKAVWFYLLLVVIGMPFLQIYYYHKSIFSAMLFLVIYLFSMLVMLALIYFPTAKISVEEKKLAAHKLSPYLILILLLLYNIMEEFIIMNYLLFMYRKFILKIILFIGRTLSVILFGQIVLKIKIKDLGFGWRHTYVIIPLCLLGTLDIVFKGFKDFSAGVPLVIFYWVLVAFREEIFYRGYLFTTLRRIFKNPVNSIVISGILFGFAHVNFWINAPILKQILMTIEQCFFGMIFSFIYYKTKSLIPSIIYHTVVNLF
ncbi:hypothetical protein BBF96_15565 [Anoxybacter fermentans]|uniref:CAAX prenyl protease 2/Lysostaphin resistance protein A-like domain-containing protein n=1 Tax=Anoxybacter fermentans TaxID=1323375 RepID=A0A3S9T2A5_9FIRM|nr:CPBP family intramembrane glutamic endopeptidase [Anoxybacter fermentans]AZR74665.1 hypothetical protein BBF96_15565 [Anoxybacter fermentans]